MARPKAIIDWSKVDKYLQAQCDGVAIAGLLGIDVDTFYRRCRIDHNIGFAEYSTIKKRQGLELLRAKQYQTAMEGDKTMQIWLGKQLLGQRDQIEQTITVPQVNVHPLNEAEQKEISTALIMLEEHESNGDIHPKPESGNAE